MTSSELLSVILVTIPAQPRTLGEIMDKRIIVAGDTHGQWSALNKVISKKNPEIILQCGDFGWWPNLHNTRSIYAGYEEVDGSIEGDAWARTVGTRRRKKWDQFGIKAGDTKVYWCDGNHEDHWDLRDERNYMKAPCQLMPNVYYMKRGSVLELPDGRNVMFMGGADSIDKQYRTSGSDWFPEEVITQKDIEDLPDIKIDIVISHTCPLEFHHTILLKKAPYWGWQKKIKDPSAHALSYILNRYKPSLWYFGHFHVHATGTHFDTKWYCLDKLPESNGWTYLQGE